SYQQIHESFASFRDPAKPYMYTTLMNCIQAEIGSELASIVGRFEPPVDIQIKTLLDAMIEEEHLILSPEVVSRLHKDIVAELLGFSVLEALIADGSITEIIVRSPQEIDVVKDGRLSRSLAVFENNDHLLRIMDRIATLLNQLPFDEAHPSLEGMLQSGI